MRETPILGYLCCSALAWLWVGNNGDLKTDQQSIESRLTGWVSPGVNWRQKLETQRGAVLANELKNNANKLAKWTAAAHISGTDMIKLGYVTRSSPKDNFHHVILGTQAGLSADQRV